MTGGICMLDGCERGGKISRGLCDSHYQRARRRGETATLPRAHREPGTPAPTCTIDACDSPVKARGLCEKHYCRWAAHGDPLTLLSGVGIPMKPVPGYDGAHRRVVAVRGRAKDHTCIDCGGQAAEWSYNNADPEPLYATVAGGFVVAYSLIIANYDPRCRSCHRKFDAAHATPTQKGA